MKMFRILQLSLKNVLLIKYFPMKDHLNLKHTIFNGFSVFQYQSQDLYKLFKTDEKNIRHITKSSIPDTESICYNEFKRLRKSKNTTVIDVRNKDETWRSGTVPGSICVPLNDLESALNMSADEFKKAYCADQPQADDTIIFICRRGGRSYRALKQAKNMGYDKCYFYQGGFLAWFEQERENREKVR